MIGYGYLQLEGETWSNGFMAVARDARGRGVAGAIKRAQIRWAKEQGIATLRTATEVRLDSMLALNRRFGYVPLYEEIVLRGPLGRGSALTRRSTALCEKRDRELRLLLERLLQRRAVEGEAAHVGHRLYARGSRSVLGEERELADDLRPGRARSGRRRAAARSPCPRRSRTSRIRPRAARSARVPPGT